MRNKFLFLLPSLKTGGGARVMFELANQLINKGYDINFIVPNNSNELHTFYLNPRIEIESVGKYKNNSIQKLLNLFKALGRSIKNNDSYIILTDPFFSLMAFLLPSKYTYRFIQADDYVIFDDLKLLKYELVLNIYKFLTKLSYKYNVQYLFNSKYTYDRFIKISQQKRISFNLVHPAINHDFFRNLNKRESEKVNICVVGRRHPWKGFIDFTAAWLKLNSELKDNVDNVFIISHDDLSSFQTNGMTIINPQNDEEIAKFMNQSHIFISTSWWEGFGLPPLEAMACGCAVILSDSGGVNEYAIPQVNCLMYKPRRERDLREKLEFLIENNAIREKLSVEGYLTAQRFSWEKSANQILEIISKYDS